MSKILIVDDDPENREILKIRLEHAGYQVEEATNGEEALGLIRKAAPDLVMLDIMMPRVDGWEVCRTLKQDPKTKGIPVMMLTALQQSIEELRGYESGADDYLTKPWDPDVICLRIQTLLTAGSAQAPEVR